MTYLELVQRLFQEASMPGTLPITTVGTLSREAAHAKRWIDSAYQDIQNLHATWLFLQKDFSFPTVAGTRSYASSADVTITSFSSWITRTVTCHLTHSDEVILDYLDWETFRMTYLIGSEQDQTGRPYAFSVDPTEKINLYPIPDDVYTIRGMYCTAPAVMTTDTGTPIFPAQFHMMIVWRALMMYAAFENAPDAYTHGQNEYNRMLSRLEDKQLPSFSWGEPLA